jgi:hypothetical protein
VDSTKKKNTKKNRKTIEKYLKGKNLLTKDRKKAKLLAEVIKNA